MHPSVHDIVGRVVKVHKCTNALYAVFTIKCIESTGKRENVICETMADAYPFKVMHKCISSLCHGESEFERFQTIAWNPTS